LISKSTSGFKLLRWSHGSRFRVARELVAPPGV
jgi:hypothetical protein